MPFNRFVEIGRVAYVAHGDDKGKLVAIVDVIDKNRAPVDGPCSGVGRKDLNFRALHLTQFTINIGPSARSGTVKKAWEKEEITKKWEQSIWAKKLARRFKLMKAKQARNRLINIEYGKLSKAERKAPARPKKLKKKKTAKKLKVRVSHAKQALKEAFKGFD
ncbi:large ribosomal subunit protein eL14-like [Physella acuta]|uniref:large ribosomal subunit protein eL14-like n=1 Tax=Physella acuta TaxID=109671 RepID=UPI0027DDC62E|nr:large ribosomal subunit protein eL14-like [Physella acuta]